MDTNQPNSGRDADAVSRMRRLQLERRTSSRALMAGVLSVYITTTRDKVLETELDSLIDSFLLVQEASDGGASRQVGRLREGRALTITGQAGAGKTRTLERHFLKREEFAGYGDRNSDCVLISVSTPSPCTLRLLGQEVLDELGYDTTRKLDENVVWEMVQHQMALRGVHFLHIDELQHVLQTRNPVEIRKVQDTLKRLMQNKTWPVWLILSGLPEIGRFFADDEQVWRRSRHVVLNDLTLEADAELVRRLITDYGKEKAKLSVNEVNGDPFIARLLHAALGRFGIVIEVIQDAIREALMGGANSLQIKHFEAAYSARTGCPADANVFTASGDWWLIRPREGLVREEPEDEGDRGDEKPKTRRTSKPSRNAKPRDRRNP
ncbi:ATP-binding protein [Microvirga makkahensis]|uniref:AAA family ATPase n=1 Tax=Microvirga makkahensis TaxID=1128670 RepID=A0A7X3MSC5_9HYPH|nr:ATP-binding protein [Microvirga makkahensis]MXQ12353.1 AAA family ATPase [Microvirga makkahensis]